MSIFKLVVTFLCALLFAQTASAALTAPTYNTEDIYTIAGALITAIAVIWGLRKAVSFANKG